MRTPIRDFEIRIDEPPRYGGEDTGPMPTEMLLATLASCFAMAVHHAARKRDVTLPDLAVRATGEYEGLGFKRITVEVLSGYTDREELERLKEQATDYCYVTNTLQRSPELIYRVVDEEVNHPPPSPPD